MLYNVLKRIASCLLALMFAGQLTFAEPRTGPAKQAAAIMEATGVKGGLIVHIGCGDGRLTAGLRANDRYVVHGLDSDAGNVEKAREYIKSLGVYGKISIDKLRSRSLPYADNLVNLIVAEDSGAVSIDELMRVLSPGGAAYIKKGRRWVKEVKPVPAEIDEWTHHLHDAGNNAVAKDTVVGPPRHLQWTAAPLWARSHGWTPSVSAMVSAKGRLFYICDETLTGVDGAVPDNWVLTARDAFSGVLLWKRAIDQWGSHSFSTMPDAGNKDTTGRFTMPPHVGKRIVAVGDTVYVTLGADAPVTAVDAATGQTRKVYPETAGADELLVVDGRLVVTLNQRDDDGRRSTKKYICGIDLKTGRLLWKKGTFTGIWATKAQDPSGRLELAAGDGHIFGLTEESLVSLSLDSGEILWKIDRPALAEHAVKDIGFAGVFEYRLAVLVYHDGVVLLAQPEPNAPHTYHTMPGTIYAFDAKSGKMMWNHPYGGWGHCTPPDVFVIDDLVWLHENVPAEFSKAWRNGVRAVNPAEVDYSIQALDLRTGSRRKRIATKDVFNAGHHHRCYRNKITERFLMASRRGVEFVDLESGENYVNHWVRSGCLLGNLPCNGLLYVAPHPCSCYIEAKLTGFNALSAQRQNPQKLPSHPFEKGPAYNKISNIKYQISNEESWPTYRHDGMRSGTTRATVSAKLDKLWTAKPSGRLSGVTAAEGKVLAADIDGHTVYAFDDDSGEGVWQYTAGGRVDSPPTGYKGMAIFGSADGWVYCLRMSDGTLIWRLRAAPEDRRVMALGQLESAWPVSGSVLICDDKCWFAAGRSSFMDGGIYVFALDPATGRVLERQTVYSPDPDTGKMILETEGHTMSGLLNDIASTDGSNVFIRHMQISSTGKPAARRLYSTAGYLDSSWFNRTYWNIDNIKNTGVMIAGGDLAYGVESYGSSTRNAVFEPGGRGYRLTCYRLSQSADQRAKSGGKSGKNIVWQKHVPIRITAMIRAGDKLFVAGSPDIADPDDPYGAWEGRKGGILAVFDATGGEKLSEIKLNSPPVWDSMAAAEGRLLISTMDGGIICFADKR